MFSTAPREPDNNELFTLFVGLPASVRTYVCTGYTDLRKSIDGLSAIVEEKFGMNPFAKSFFLFCGISADRLKILFYDGDSFNVTVRRLEKIRLKWPRVADQMWLISRFEFINLLSGEKLRENLVIRIITAIP